MLERRRIRTRSHATISRPRSNGRTFPRPFEYPEELTRRSSLPTAWSNAASATRLR